MQIPPEDAERIAADIARSREQIRKSTTTDDRLVFFVLAAAYLIVFGGQYLVSQIAHGPRAVAAILAIASGIVAVVVIIWHSQRRLAGLRGPMSRRPQTLGVAWGVSALLFVAAIVAARLIAPDLAIQLVVNVAACFFSGLMYLASGIVCRYRIDMGVGIWLMVTAVVAAVMGAPACLLLIALAGSLGLLAAALLATMPRYRGPNR